MITKPNTLVVRAARVADDGRFLRWLEYAKEALPVDDVAVDDQGEEAPVDAETGVEQRETSSRSLDEIPAAIVVKRQDSKSSGAPPTKPVEALPPKREKSAPARKKSLGEVSKKKRIQREPVGKVDEEIERKPLDTSRFASFDDYNEGKTKVAPLKRGATMDGTKGLERPKFLDGKLPRSVERGVLHPAPVRLVVTSLLLMLTKLLLFATIIVLPVAAYLDTLLVDGKHHVKDALPVLILFLVAGAAFIIVGNKARCRVCSCHFFFTRRCHKHKSAHRLPLMGAAGTAALHLLMFKWMRCMYCGTAIRLRGSTGIGKPSKDGKHYDSDEGEED